VTSAAAGTVLAAFALFAAVRGNPGGIRRRLTGAAQGVTQVKRSRMPGVPQIKRPATLRRPQKRAPATV